MTRTLILMRHAKSSWSDPFQEDHDRPLNKRGRRSAAALGDWLRAEGLAPDQVICSSASRTQETLDRLRLDLNAAPEPRLYHAGPELMLEVLREAGGHCVLMVGHNPGIADFAHWMVSESPDHLRFGDYPTGATLVVNFPVDDWNAIRPGTGVPSLFIIPRELTGDT